MEVADLWDASDIVPGGEQVTYTPIDTRYAAFDMYNARFRGTTDNAEFQAAGITISTEFRNWCLQAKELPDGYTPRVGDKITPAAGSLAPGESRVQGILPFMANGEFKVHCQITKK